MRIGIDLGGTKIEAIALAAGGRECFRRRVPTPRGNYSDTLDAVAALVTQADGVNRESRPATVGIGIPGVVSPATGLVKNANSTWLIGKPLADDLAQRLGRPVRLANDANCFALSEATDGAAAGASVVFGVILGTGVGGGLVVHGRVVTGANAIAGEWGHNPMPWPTSDELPGPPCYCGRRGCIETFLSGPGLALDHERATGVRLDAMAIAAAASAGDAQPRLTLERYYQRIARALASIINVIDPDVVVFGGGLSNLEEMCTRVPGLWNQFVFSDRVDTRVVKAAHGDSSGVRGAAWLWEEPAAVDDRR